MLFSIYSHYGSKFEIFVVVVVVVELIYVYQS